MTTNDVFTETKLVDPTGEEELKAGTPWTGHQMMAGLKIIKNVDLLLHYY